MKRIISLILTTILLFSISSAFAQDFSSMTDAELKEQYDYIRNELTTRGLKAENKTVIYDKGGIQIYLNGSPFISNEWIPKQFAIPIIVVNNSEKNIAIGMSKSSLNGWTTRASILMNEIPIGKKLKSELHFALDSTDLENDDDFEDAEFTFTIYDSDTWDIIIPESELINIYPSN